MLKLPKNKFGCFVFWPLAAYMSIGAIQNLSEMRTLDKTGVITAAEIIAHEVNSKGKTVPTFKYTVLDTDYTVTTRELLICARNIKGNAPCRPSSYEIGRKIDIRVNTEDPEQFLLLAGGGTKEKTFAYILFMVFLIFAPWIVKIPEDD